MPRSLEELIKDIYTYWDEFDSLVKAGANINEMIYVYNRIGVIFKHGLTYEEKKQYPDILYRGKKAEQLLSGYIARMEYLAAVKYHMSREEYLKAIEYLVQNKRS